MRAGTYKGKIEALRGCHALLISHPVPGYVSAQFDRFDTALGDGPLEKDLAHGWHRFPIADFDEDLELC